MITIPQNGDVDGRPRAQAADGVAHIGHGASGHILPAHADKYIACHQAAFGSRRTFGHAGYEWRGNRHAVSRHQPDSHHKGQHEVHQRARRHGDHALPYGGIVIVAGIVFLFAVGVVVGIAIEHAVAAQGDRPDGKHGLVLFAFPLNELGTKADGILLYGNPAQAGSREMAKLMDRNQHAQQHDSKQNIQCDQNPFFGGISLAYAEPAARYPAQDGQPP